MSQHRKVSALVASGEFQRPPVCVGCGATAEEGFHMQAHNEDYHHPLRCVGICFSCHMAIHHRFKDLEAWRIYRDLAANGHQPFKGRDYWGWLRHWTSLKKLPAPSPVRKTWFHDLPDEEPNLFDPAKVGIDIRVDLS
jgi:hypothetical protein